MRKKPVRTLASILAFLFLAAGCVGSRDSAVEQAQFLLDHGNYTEAAALLQPVVAANPQDDQATFLLASALIGKSVLGTSRSYLGLFADLLNDPSTGETGFQTFARIAPASSSSISDLEAATDLLENLTTFASSVQLGDVYLQLYISRLFEISGVITQVGVCGAGYDPTAFVADTAANDRFQQNLDQVNGDGVNAGIPSDFPLTSRITSIVEDLNTPGGTLGFLDNQFAAAGIAAQICP
ncbi:MAG: hypothetical protein V1798_04775 [Pseudomonadota bacterium]